MILGIDPGAGGALAWVSEPDGALIAIADMPIIEILGKKRVSPQQLAALIEARKPRLAVVEEVGAMPGQGVSSMFAFGYAAGIIAGALAGLRIPVVMYRPSKWKREAGCPADKGATRVIAQRYWPGSRDFDRAKDDGRAEAALLARWIATDGNM